MKPSKIFWGVFFLGLGVLLLVKNFSDVDFYMPEIRKFWPLLLIAGGVVYLTKNLIVRNVLAGVAGFCLAFFLLTVSASIHNLPKKFFGHVKSSKDKNSLISIKTEPYDTTIKFVELSFDGGAGTYIVNCRDTNLMTLKTDRSNRKFSVNNNIAGGKANLDIQMAEFHFDTDDTSFASLVELNINPKPFYESLNFQIGASEFELNISQLQFRKLNIDMGASSTRLFLPKPAPGSSEVTIECGASSMDIIVSKDAQVKLINSMALSDSHVPKGFVEKNGVIYSENFTGTGDILTIKLDGGVNSLKIRRD
ncbi:MAG: DUF5668 domain-containing protein [Bacteroidetes bacterium]|nr:DUF5668 domain-containing protein [Bacteroidota bacterium]